MTGAYSALNINVVPSFMILEFKSNEIVIYEYSLVEGELKCVDAKIPKVWLLNIYWLLISSTKMNEYKY
jgi:hypothetical protein